MSGKRILILTNRVPYPLNDGGNLAMHAMIESYREAGWKVALMSMNTTRHYITPDQISRIYNDIDSFETVPVDNRVKPLNTMSNFLFSNVPNHVMRFTNAEFASRLKCTIDDFDPDVIQVESIFLTGYLADVRKEGKIKTVLRLHNIEYQIWQRLAMEYKGFVKYFYFKNLSGRIKSYEEWAWKQYNLLLPITDVDAAVVKQSDPAAPTLTVPFGIDTNKVKATQADLKKGYHIGAMDWIPNREAMTWFLQDVWPTLHKEVPDFKFYFAGRDMPASFAKLNIEGATCMGEVPDANTFIADKKILIVPLRSGGGIRVKILEAMAAGKVVISTEIGMQGIDAIDDVHYIRANDARAFINAVKWCLSKPEQAEIIANNARKLALEKYDRQVIMLGLNQKLQQMLAPKA
ncbi:MAG: glycosyltransferase [Sphingobacteriales bacterium]|nr:MAG: glycosyltransferase [Sphingobacteriales bacterium]